MRRARGSQPTFNGQVFSEQVGCSFDIAGDSYADCFDVVAFPVHLFATASSHGSHKCAEIG